MKCRSCNKIIISKIIDLGFQPWCNNFLKKDKLKTESYYPLKLFYCSHCKLLQLEHTVPKEVMFSNHTYLSGVSEELVNHFYNLAKENIEQFDIRPRDLIIDIGGNDGSQLMQYKKLGCERLLNYESCENAASISYKKNDIPTIQGFFEEKQIVDNEFSKKAKLINASGVLFHLENLHRVLDNIKCLLDENGILIAQFMHAGQMIDNNTFDMIYHEHLCYYTLESFRNLLNNHKLRIFDAYYSSIHSGSIIAKVCHEENTNFKETERLIKTSELDKKYTFQKFLTIQVEAEKIKRDLFNLLTELIYLDKRIYAFGAPAKGNTLLNWCGINNQFIIKAVEQNELKIGLYLPQSYIPIEKESKEDLPDYYLLLSHNLRNSILERYKDEINSKKVKFIIPFPTLQIINEYVECK